MTSDKGKNRGVVEGHQHESQPPPPQYGTFQGVPSYPPPQPPPTTGFPQPAPPPGATCPPHPQEQYYTQGYQSVPGYAVAEGRPVQQQRRLPCCGCGLGWCLFIIGFFLAGIPWYVGALLLICSRGNLDYREKPGYIACTIAAVLEIVGIIIGVTKGTHSW